MAHDESAAEKPGQGRWVRLYLLVILCHVVVLLLLWWLSASHNFPLPQGS
jgi:hypothetical protein